MCFIVKRTAELASDVFIRSTRMYVVQRGGQAARILMAGSRTDLAMMPEKSIGFVASGFLLYFDGMTSHS